MSELYKVALPLDGAMPSEPAYTISANPYEVVNSSFYYRLMPGDVMELGTGNFDLKRRPKVGMELGIGGAGLLAVIPSGCNFRIVRILYRKRKWWQLFKRREIMRIFVQFLGDGGISCNGGYHV